MHPADPVEEAPAHDVEDLSLTGKAFGLTAMVMAGQLKGELELLNVPSHVMGDKERASCSLWPYLVAMTDGRMIWWPSPYPSARGGDLWTLAWAPATAAMRLAGHYREFMKLPLPGPLSEIALLTVLGGDRP